MNPDPRPRLRRVRGIGKGSKKDLVCTCSVRITLTLTTAGATRAAASTMAVPLEPEISSDWRWLGSVPACWWSVADAIVSKASAESRVPSPPPQAARGTAMLAAQSHLGLNLRGLIIGSAMDSPLAARVPSRGISSPP